MASLWPGNGNSRFSSGHYQYLAGILRHRFKIDFSEVLGPDDLALYRGFPWVNIYSRYQCKSPRRGIGFAFDPVCQFKPQRQKVPRAGNEGEETKSG